MAMQHCAGHQESTAVIALMKSVVDQCQQSLSTCEQSVAITVLVSKAIADDGFPYFTLGVLMLGCGCIVSLVYKEYAIYCKIASSIELSISFGEYLLCRLDFYFSSSQWAKPLLLLSVTFVLIVVAAIVHMLILGDSMSAAMWKAWTYVADPGDSKLISFLIDTRSSTN